MKHIKWLAKMPKPQRGHYLIDCDNGRSDILSTTADILPRDNTSGVNYMYWTGENPREALIVCQVANFGGYDIRVYQELEGKWGRVGGPHRDPNDRCDVYRPGTPRTSGKCNADGHFLCDHCIHKRLSDPSVAEGGNT